MMAVSSLPLAEPEATSALSRSPVDRWVKPYFSTILSHWVPLPLPGPPRHRNITHEGLNPLPDDETLDWSKLKQTAEDILKCI